MSRNHLGGETSPYLLQHQANPVHWRAWTHSALAEAREQNKPILLSVGYAACHWCHVMAHESFENEAIAARINADFIPIKVDREERPDIDLIYQNALAAMGQSGGWPLTMFLTPDGRPFWGGTYFPATDHHGRPAFPEILAALAEVYRTDPARIAENADALMAHLANPPRPADGLGGFDLDILDRAAQAVAGVIDRDQGGVARAPKFPQVPLFLMLARAALRNRDPSLSNLVTVTLDHISDGGICDHLGGGFARYSTDEEWKVPHFEKMLYDNAQLLDLLALSWQAWGKSLYRERAEGIVAWLTHEMDAGDGTFAASLDADSEGGEGRFYVWTAAEIDQALAPDLAHQVRSAYEVTEDGNWEEGRSVLHRNHPAGRAPGIDEDALARARFLLLAERARRPRPGRDDKVLADWNGMIIAALAQAGFAFSRPDWILLAERAFAGIRNRLGADGRHLVHSWCQGRAQDHAMLDDYAQMARAALALFETTGKPAYLAQAVAWVETATLDFADPADGAFFFTPRHAALVVRPKTARDSATPSGNAVIAETLARLYHLTGQDDYRRRAEAVFTAFAPELNEDIVGLASLMNAWEVLSEGVQIVLAGDDEAVRPMARSVAEIALPNRVLYRLRPGETPPPGHPAHGKSTPDQAAAAYVCHHATCSLPVRDALELRRSLLQG